MISASHTAKSSLELELYLYSVNRGADICDKYEPESCDFGRGIWGVNGLYGVEGTVVTGVFHILTASALGGVDWHLFSELSVTGVHLGGCLSPAMGLVIHCAEVALGG